VPSELEEGALHPDAELADLPDRVLLLVEASELERVLTRVLYLDAPAVVLDEEALAVDGEAHPQPVVAGGVVAPGPEASGPVDAVVDEVVDGGHELDVSDEHPYEEPAGGLGVDSLRVFHRPPGLGSWLAHGQRAVDLSPPAAP